MKKKTAIVPRMFTVAMLLIVAIACSETPKPSNSDIEAAVRAQLESNIPGRWIDAAIPGRKTTFSAIEVKEWGAFNKEQNYWPVKVRVAGITETIPPFGKSFTRNFDELAEFRFSKDDYGAWVWSFLEPGLFGGEQWITGKLKPEALNKQRESTQNVAQTASPNANSSNVTASSVDNKVWTKEELLTKGSAVYSTTCMACHQANGQGIPGVFSALAGSAIATGPVANHIDMVVNGSKKNPAMQAFGQQLSPIDLAAVITFERNSFGNNMGDMVQPSEIRTVQCKVFPHKCR